MAGSRNPKDLKEMVAASQDDMSDMQTNLAKLRGLTADDKTENAILRSRIDEQSELIMILKQRADESVLSTKTLGRINQELEDFRNSAQEELEMQMRKTNMLDARFNDLAQNHQQLILIKDEYKRGNEDLRRENFQIRQDNERLFSKAVEDRDKKIVELERKAANMNEQCVNVSQKYRETQEALKVMEEKTKAEIRELSRRLQESEERLKGAQSKLLNQSTSQQSASSEAQAKIQALTKEKDEMLNLAMSRGKLIQEKQAENKKLDAKILQLEKAMKSMEEKFERDSASVNVNMTVRKLKAELEEADEKYDEVIREFQAFKKHSGALLQREKDLNERLRHLMG